MATIVKQHRTNDKDKKKQEKQGAKAAGTTEDPHPIPNPGVEQRHKHAQIDATGTRLETIVGVHTVSSLLLATGQHTTPAKKGTTDPGWQNCDQDAHNMQSGRAGCSTGAKGGTIGNSERR